MVLSAHTFLRFLEFQTRCPNASGQLIAVLTGLIDELRFGLVTDIEVDFKIEDGKTRRFSFVFYYDIPSGKSKNLDAAYVRRFLKKHSGSDFSLKNVRLLHRIPATLKVNDAQDRLEYDLECMKAQNEFEVQRFVSAVVAGWKNWMKEENSIDLDHRHTSDE